MLQLALTLRKRLLLLLCVFLVGFFMVAVISGIVTWKAGMTTPAVRIVTILQDVVMFVLPPVITAVLVTRQPATLLRIDTKPNWIMLLIAVVTMIASIPAMNYIVALNEHLPLPQPLAESLRSMEDQAQGTIALLMGEHTVANLIMTVLIVGVMAGLSEELLFRGGLQRLLHTGGYSAHTAIWVSAAIFSLMHAQLYGFVPRMLLGAYFGYTLYWSRCLWIPIMLHALNNTLYILTEWYGSEPQTPWNESLALDGLHTAYVIMSAGLVALGIKALQKYTHSIAS